MRKRMAARSWVLVGAACIGLAMPAHDATPAQVSAVEFRHAEFNHFFFTTLPAEMALLDAGAIPGWSRTWTEFKVHDTPGPDLVPVCRFFSRAFAPRSSHFYSAFAEECASVAADSRWTYEGTAFYATLPDAMGACPGGTIAIHRGYNMGQGGAPAHRLSPWPQDACGPFHPTCALEGRGPGGVAFCAPVSPDLALIRTRQLAGTTWDFTEVVDGVATTRRTIFGVDQPHNLWHVPPQYMLDMPYVVPTAPVGVAGWDPLAGKVNFIFLHTLYQFDFDGGHAVTGCAYRFEDLFAEVRGPCHPLTGRKL